MADVILVHRHGHIVQVQSMRDGATVVTDCPANKAPDAALRLSQIVFWPIPDLIAYDRLMALRPGGVVLGETSGGRGGR